MGHISPLLGIILEYRYDYDFVYFGLENSMEEAICNKYNIRFHKMNLEPFYRKNIFKNFKTFYLIFKERSAIRKKYKHYNCSVIISSGGFVSVPLITSFKNKKIILLESNTTLGLANRFLSLFADYVGIQFDSIKHRKSIMLGNPIKICEPIFDHPWFYKNEKIILFVGGSNGAFDIVKLAYEFNNKFPHIKIFVITGEKYYETFIFNHNAIVLKKIFELNSVLNKFNLVVSRAGASTITELILSNTPFLLVPSHNVSGNHQVLNAKYLKEKGVCEVLYELNFERDTLMIERLIYDAEKLNNMLKKQEKLKIKDSLIRIKCLIEK